MWIDDDLKECIDINSEFYVVATLNKESLIFYEEYVETRTKIQTEERTDSAN